MVDKDNCIRYRFDSNVSIASKKAIQRMFSDICNKTIKNQEFFSGLKVNVYGNWEDSYEFKKISDGRMGFTKYPVADIGRNIYLQTLESNSDDSIVKSIGSNKNLVNESAIHELGHVFDYYFADPNPQIENRLKEFFQKGADYRKEHNDEYIKLLKEYKTQNGLSDSDVFKKAWIQDVEVAFKGKSDTHAFNKRLKLGYFSPTYNYENNNKNEKIKLKDGIDEREILYADRAREEIFAQLFAYAFDAECDKKEKELIINTYPACYKVVQKYISEYLGVNLTYERPANFNIEA